MFMHVALHNRARCLLACKRRDTEEESARENENESGGEQGGGREGACVQPELNPFGSILCLAFCVTALKSHASQPHKLTSL